VPCINLRRIVSSIALASLMGILSGALLAGPASASSVKQTSNSASCRSSANSVRNNVCRDDCGNAASCTACTANAVCNGCSNTASCTGDCSNAANCRGCSANEACSRDCGNAVCGGCTANAVCKPPVRCTANKPCAQSNNSSAAQDPGRYLVWSPSKGCWNLQDDQVQDALKEPGSRMGVYIDGYRLDATGGLQFIGATCDPPSKFGTVSDDGYYVAPNGLPNGMTDSIADPSHTTDALYRHFSLLSAPINPF
jgi:hypothetical protein